ncbi:hypothetical protein LDC_1719 [sediment metagenome]|uniref:Uncharacterized protein n=1 Tax=sediment metagenome TaxID=749907 RepID=D9PJK8_9ZZZZ
MKYYETNPVLNTLDNLGVGAANFQEFEIRETNINKLESLINKFGQVYNWQLSRNERDQNILILEYQSGGLSVSGYQQITITLTQVENNVKIGITSKSRGGQISDWGANKFNIDNLKSYLNDPSQKLHKKSNPGDKKGFLLMILVMFVGPVLFIILLNVLYRLGFF